MGGLLSFVTELFAAVATVLHVDGWIVVAGIAMLPIIFFVTTTLLAKSLTSARLRATFAVGLTALLFGALFLGFSLSKPRDDTDIMFSGTTTDTLPVRLENRTLWFYSFYRASHLNATIFCKEKVIVEKIADANSRFHYKWRTSKPRCPDTDEYEGRFVWMPQARMFVDIGRDLVGPTRAASAEYGNDLIIGYLYVPENLIDRPVELWGVQIEATGIDPHPQFGGYALIEADLSADQFLERMRGHFAGTSLRAQACRPAESVRDARGKEIRDAEERPFISIDETCRAEVEFVEGTMIVRPDYTKYIDPNPHPSSAPR